MPRSTDAHHRSVAFGFGEHRVGRLEILHPSHLASVTDGIVVDDRIQVDDTVFHKIESGILHTLVERIGGTRGSDAIATDAGKDGHLMRAFLQDGKCSGQLIAADDLVIDIHPCIRDFMGASAINGVVAFQRNGVDMDIGGNRLRAFELLARSNSRSQQRETQ